MSTYVPNWNHEIDSQINILQQKKNNLFTERDNIDLNIREVSGSIDALRNLKSKMEQNEQACKKT